MKYSHRRRLRPNTPPSSFAVFHTVSHIVDRRLVLAPPEKAQFLELMRRYERFCQVQVLGYCIMENHFHILVKVPGRPDARPTQEALVEHVRTTLGQTIAGHYQERIDFWEQQLHIGLARNSLATDSTAGTPSPSPLSLNSPADFVLPDPADLADFAATQLEKVTRDIWQRMFDVSQFIFSLKQQFSHWFNKKHNRVGTLWEERFRATLVQPGAALAEVSAYMDLNPVRAGLVREAREYPWSQYGAAIAGDELALKSLEALGQILGWESKARAERFTLPAAPLFGLKIGLSIFAYLLHKRSQRDSESPQAWDPTLELVLSDPLPHANYVRGQVRSFTRGVALGDAAFLERVLREYRDQFGPNRKHAPRPIHFPPLPESSELENAVCPPSSGNSSPQVSVRKPKMGSGNSHQIGSMIKALREIAPRPPKQQ